MLSYTALALALFYTLCEWTSQKKNEIGKRKAAKKRKSNISAVGQRILMFCVPGQIFPRAVFVLNHVHQAMRVYTFMQPLHPSDILTICPFASPSPPPPFFTLPAMLEPSRTPRPISTRFTADQLYNMDFHVVVVAVSGIGLRKTDMFGMSLRQYK